MMALACAGWPLDDDKFLADPSEPAQRHLVITVRADKRRITTQLLHNSLHSDT